MIRALSHRAGFRRPIAGAVTPYVSTDSLGVPFRDHLRRSLAAPVGERAHRDHRNRTAVGPSLFLPAARVVRAVPLRPVLSRVPAAFFFPRVRSSRQAIGGRAPVPAYLLNLHREALLGRPQATMDGFSDVQIRFARDANA